MVIVALNACVMVLRRDDPKHDWYQPTFKSPLYPYVQIFGIIAGGTLVALMGSKAIIGAEKVKTIRCKNLVLLLH